MPHLAFAASGKTLMPFSEVAKGKGNENRNSSVFLMMELFFFG